MEIEIEAVDLLTLAAMASKACEYLPSFIKGLHMDGMVVEAGQVEGMMGDCSRVLGKLDKAFPGMIPVPHDGELWSEKLERNTG